MLYVLSVPSLHFQIDQTIAQNLFLDILFFFNRWRNSFGLVHTDLKPENILLLDANERNHRGRTIPASSRIKIIDFGGATYDDEKKSHVVNTRQYRAPEVILGTGWSMPSDIWSIGTSFHGMQMKCCPTSIDNLLC